MPIVLTPSTPTPVVLDGKRAERLASFDPTVAALVLASPPLSPERRDRLRVIFGAAS